MNKESKQVFNIEECQINHIDTLPFHLRKAKHNALLHKCRLFSNFLPNCAVHKGGLKSNFTVDLTNITSDK